MVQIFQEAMLLGVDGADLLRQVRLVLDESDPTCLILEQAYKKQVEEMHEKLLREAETLNAEIIAANKDVN
jgi:hypothetical protein